MNAIRVNHPVLEPASELVYFTHYQPFILERLCDSPSCQKFSRLADVNEQKATLFHHNRIRQAH